MLDAGSTFAGFKIEKVKDGEVGRTFLFVKGSEGVYITIPYDDLFTLMTDSVEKDRVEDHLAAALWAAYRDKSGGIWSKPSDN